MTKKAKCTYSGCNKAGCKKKHDTDALPFWQNMLRWGGAIVIVMFAYVAGAVGIYNYRSEPELLAGPPEAIMLEFSEEVSAPDLEAFSEEIKPETQIDEPEPVDKTEEEVKPEPESEPEPVEEKVEEEIKPDPVVPPKSDMVEEKKVEKKPEPVKKKVEKPVVKKVEKPKPKVVSKPRPKAEPRQQAAKRPAQKGEQNQKLSGPQINAKKGSTYTAPATNRSDGSNGKSVKAWGDRVHKKILGIALRMQRQLPGARGLAVVSFGYDGSGRITSVHITRGSGNARLDDLAKRIVQSASPLPTPPGAIGGSSVVPIRIN